MEKNTARLGTLPVFVDESGFMMIPSVRRTLASIGQTLILRHYYRRDRFSVIGGLSVSPKRCRFGLYFRMQARNISQEETYDFQWYLLRHLRGHMMVVWDNASIDDSKPLRDLLRKYPRVHLEYLPAYAPRLNPVEAAWHAAQTPLSQWSACGHLRPRARTAQQLAQDRRLASHTA